LLNSIGLGLRRRRALRPIRTPNRKRLFACVHLVAIVPFHLEDCEFNCHLSRTRESTERKRNSFLLSANLNLAAAISPGTSISVSEPPNQTPLKSSEMVILNPSASVSNMGMLGQTFAFSHSEIFPRSMPN